MKEFKIEFIDDRLDWWIGKQVTIVTASDEMDAIRKLTERLPSAKSVEIVDIREIYT